MGQGRRQTERITRKQAGSERQAANDQERESTVQVEHGKTKKQSPPPKSGFQTLHTHPAQSRRAVERRWNRGRERRARSMWGQ